MNRELYSLKENKQTKNKQLSFFLLVVLLLLLLLVVVVLLFL